MSEEIGYCQTCCVVKDGKITNERMPMERISEKDDDPLFYCKICDGLWLYETTWSQYYHVMDLKEYKHQVATAIFDELDFRFKTELDFLDEVEINDKPQLEEIDFQIIEGKRETVEDIYNKIKDLKEKYLSPKESEVSQDLTSRVNDVKPSFDSGIEKKYLSGGEKE